MKKFFKKGELKLLWPFYTNALVLMFAFYALFAIAYFTKIGLMPIQIGLLYTVMSIVSIVFEIPTSAIADIYGRKFSTILGYILSGIVPILIYFTTNYNLLLLYFGIWGLAFTFQSGADHAWVIDLLKSKKKDNLIDEYYAKETSIYSFSNIISGLLGASVVLLFGLKSIWLFLGSTYLIGTIILSFGKEHFIRKKQHIKKHVNEFISHNKKSLKYAKKDSNILRFLVSALFLATAFLFFMSEIVWVPLFMSSGIKESFLGIITSAVGATSIFAPFVSKYFSKKNKGKKKVLLWILSLMFVLMILISLSSNLIFIISIYLILQFLLYCWSPTNMSFFQVFLPSKMRATIFSFRAFVVSIARAFTPIVAGFIIESHSPKLVLYLGAIFLIPVIIIYSKIKEKK